jgi:hypothetical protein
LDEQDDGRRVRAPEPDDAVRICGGVVIPVPSLATLIRMMDAPRPQDAIDRAFLEGVLRERDAQRRPR